MQTPSYQREMAERLQLPFAVLSDEHMAFTQALRLPTFHAAGMQLIKRLTLIARQGKVAAVKYPVFPSHSDAPWAVEWLRQHP
jgi:peroxiredoxin